MVKNEAVDKIVASLAGYVTKSSKDEPIERLMRALIPLFWQRSGRGQAPSLERYALHNSCSLRDWQLLNGA
jgi:hypothetical protein